ncbi:integrase arm-type DNA-binding domain-containing protein [Rhizorhapis sp. SPR117]|uniref:integrase arm-type DNA-binding domain-containing protein n=1 Tax=Rhizorhapis sp. SPR117 TaxID=2912611 RepID=UPI00403E8C94
MMGKLTAIAVKAALAKPGTYQDGEGLFLKVDKRGGAYWLLRLQRDAAKGAAGYSGGNPFVFGKGVLAPDAQLADGHCIAQRLRP